MDSAPGTTQMRVAMNQDLTSSNPRSLLKFSFSHRMGFGPMKNNRPASVLVPSLCLNDTFQRINVRAGEFDNTRRRGGFYTVKCKYYSGYLRRVSENNAMSSSEYLSRKLNFDAVKLRRRKYRVGCESSVEKSGEGSGKCSSGDDFDMELTENISSSNTVKPSDLNLTDSDIKGFGRDVEVSDEDLERSKFDCRGEGPSLEAMRELLQNASKDLEEARHNSSMFEEKAQKISEAAIAARDKAVEARDEADETTAMIQVLITEEVEAQEALNKAKVAVSSAQVQTKLALEALEKARENTEGCIGEVETESRGKGDEENTDLSIDVQTPKKANSQESIAGIGDEEDSRKQKILEAPTLEEEVALLIARDELRKCEAMLANCEADLLRIQKSKLEVQARAEFLNENAIMAEMKAAQADEDVANVMALAEEAVALEVEVAQRVSDAEIALQRAEKSFVESGQNISLTVTNIADKRNFQAVKPAEVLVSNLEAVPVHTEGSFIDAGAAEGRGSCSDNGLDGSGRREDGKTVLVEESAALREETYSQESTLQVADVMGENTRVEAEVVNDAEIEKLKFVLKEAEQDKAKVSFQPKKVENAKDTPATTVPKTSTKKSSRFFSASFFSFEDDGAEFTPATIFSGFVSSFKNQLPKLVVGMLLLGAGAVYLNNRMERMAQTMEPTGIVTGIEEVAFNARPLVRELQRIPKRVKSLVEKLPHQEVNEEETSLFDVLWLLLASVIFVPLFQKIPGGSPVLGYLAAGILIGPYGLSIIRHVHGTKAIAEFGVVFLLFNIGLELSVERLSSMKKYVFGLGSAQVLATAIVVGLIAHFITKQSGPASIVIGNGLALSSTAVVLQVLQERGESTSRHGRATFSVLLFQDLAVVVLLILIPLISPNSSKGGVGFQAIAEALGVAAVKALVAITGIIAGGRLLLRPIYKQIAENQNAEIFSANTLLVVLGTSVLTARAGLSMALGAFLAGLLLAETEFSLQVESDIAPYRGLLLGLFFMTVGMSIDPKLLVAKFPVILGALSLLIGGKTILVASVGRLFGISSVAAIRVGLLLAPGGEFAFVAFGEAVNQGIMTPQLSSLLFLVVGLSMAITPWLAAGGQLIATRFEQHDVRSLLPAESETDDLQDHIIICGFGRVGQIIAQLLSERLIPFVALDVRSERVAAGRALDLPVYFGDAGSREVLHKVGAERAAAAAVTLDTPGANFRTVWALSKYFPNVKTFVRAHDVDHGINLEKAGATAVVPETLEPSLQLAAALLAQAKLPASEIAATINEFRSHHLSELTELCESSGSSPGYGFLRIMGRTRQQPSDFDDGLGDLKQEGMLAVQ